MDGSFLIGSEAVTTSETFHAIAPATNTLLDIAFSMSDLGHVERACKLADSAFDVFRETDPGNRAVFLEAIAHEIEKIDGLVERAAAESGLSQARLIGEIGRTCNQLRLFSTLLRKGRWIDVVIDQAMPQRKPLPRADLRQRRVAVGPVAVFGASNFPLAFSVAGGDTASALAAGCPVVCKGHPAHPGTSEMVGRAIRQAVRTCGLHEGVFSLLQGTSHELGAALVTDPRIKAVGFTGSRVGGLALVELAQRRPEPIPVYAEMSSINPVILFPEALETGAVALAEGFVASLTLGAGQFCTNPGVVIALDSPNLDTFCEAAAAALAASPPQVMLTRGIHANYDESVARLEAHRGVQILARGIKGTGSNLGSAALFDTPGEMFLDNPDLAREVFGATSIIVRCADFKQVTEVLAAMEGQLTATLQVAKGDYTEAAKLIPLLESKVGRILANSWPTGVEVSDAMVHGGPFPATSDPRATSVGMAAIERFLRPICYQDLPDALLPKALRRSNPLNLPRTVDGEFA